MHRKTLLYIYIIRDFVVVRESLAIGTEKVTMVASRRVGDIGGGGARNGGARR